MKYAVACIFIVIFTTGCSPTNPQSSDQEAIQTINFSVPSGVSNSDIFDQLIWVPTGGEGGLGPLGECSECIVTDIGFGPKISLRKFLPWQSLRLDIYREFDGECDTYLGLHVGSWNVQVDGNGNLDITLSEDYEDVFVYSIYDSQSDRLEWRFRFALVDSECRDQNVSTDSSYPCSGNISTRLQVGDDARVSITNGTPLRIRTEPVISQSTYIASIPEGTTLEITNGPACNDDYIWWYVTTANGYHGWMAEGSSGDWYIEPIR